MIPPLASPPGRPASAPHGDDPGSPSVLDVMTDADLFAPHFKMHRTAGDTWARWRTFLRALFALPPEPGDLETYAACAGRADWPAEPATEAALIVGRRGGKSRVLALIAVFLATFRDYGEFLAPGEVGVISVIAADRKQARAIFRFASGLLKNTALLAPLIADSTTEAITLTNRTAIEIGTASFRSVRGATLIAALADEVAFWRSEDTSANPDVEILRALRPALGTIPGAMLLLASSPYAKKGELYRAFRQYYGKPGADVLVWKADTRTMNPAFPQKTIDREYEKDPEASKAEYGAEFREDLADFITREAIDAITCWGRHELPPTPGITYAAFCDPSGGSSDAMTLAVAHLEGDAGVLDAVLEIRAPFSPDVAVAECVALLRRYNVARAVSDRYAGAWPVARFRDQGIALEQSARGKSDLYHDFLALANARRVELLDHPRMAAQFVGLERRTARSGKDSIAEPPGAHDDICNGVAGVLVGLDLDRRPSLIPAGALARGEDAPGELGFVRGFYATVWVGIDGRAAYALFALRPFVREQPLAIVDFDVAPWSASIMDTVAQRLDDLCEEARAANPHSRERGVGALIFAPDQIVEGAQRALDRAFASRAGRHDARLRTVAAEAIDARLVHDPVRLAFNASAHVTDGKVLLSALAEERGRTVPLLGALAIAPGEQIDADPLRMAMMLGIVIGIDATPDAAPAIPAARVVFG